MSEPQVTIVTPSFNQGRFIRATIESVLGQDYPRLEYIIMDGGSTDETAAVAKDYSSRLTWISERDRGQSHAINKGFRLAKGSVLSWLNSDDCILPGAVRRAVNAFSENPEAGAVYGEGYLLDRDGKITGRFVHTAAPDLWKLTHLSDYILQQTSYFQRAAIEQVGYLREDFHYVMDWDLLIRIGKRYPLEYIPEYMGCLREYPEAKSFSGGRQRVREIAALLREHTGLKYPPGYISYGLQTYKEIWRESLRARSPRLVRPLIKKLEALMTLCCNLSIEQTIRLAQGWYGDRWAGPSLKYMLPAGGVRCLILCGRIPKYIPQKLTVIAAGAQVAEKKFPPGDFEWRVQIPASKDAIAVRLKSSRWFLPSLREGPLAMRRLSYRLDSIRVEPAAEHDPSREAVCSARAAAAKIAE